MLGPDSILQMRGMGSFMPRVNVDTKTRTKVHPFTNYYFVLKNSDSSRSTHYRTDENTRHASIVCTRSAYTNKENA